MKEIKLGKLDTHLRQFELDLMDVRVIERMYHMEWHDRGTIGGPQMWFNIIVKFLESQGYTIEKKIGQPK